MSEKPLVPGESVDAVQEVPEAGTSKKRRVRKRVIAAPLLVAALIPVGWGAVALASPVVDSWKVKSDLVTAAEQVSKDSSGKYQYPDQFGVNSIVSFAEVGAGEFCLAGNVLDDGSYSDPKFYSSVTGKVSKSPDDCLNLDGDAETYKCLPSTLDYMRSNVAMVDSPDYHEERMRHYKTLDRLEADDAPQSALDREYLRHSQSDVVKLEMEQWEDAKPELADNEAGSLLSGHELSVRDEVGMTTSEYTAQDEAFRAYTEAAGNEANYDKDGNILPEKEAELEELHEKAVQTAEDYYLGVMCN